MAQKNRPQAETLYGLPQPLQTGLYPPIIAKRDPTTMDTGYPIGQVWVNKIGNSFFGLASVTAGSANWEGFGDTTGMAPISKYVVAADGSADYTTVQAALDAANAAGGNAVVFLRPGTYTENLTLYDTVDLQGTSYAGCTITGVHTPPATGRVLLQSLTLTSSTHIFSSAVAGSAQIAVDNCEIVVTTGFLFNLANWTGDLLVFDTGSTGTNDGFVNNTGGSLVYVIASEVGAGTTQTMVSRGAVSLFHTEVGCPVNMQTGGSLTALGCLFNDPLTFSNNSTATINNSRISTGASAAITQSSSGALTVSDVTITSSANPAIAGAGAGAVNLGTITFTSGKNIASTVDVAYLPAVGRVSAYIVGSTGNFGTIQAALDAANADGGNATVWVQPGTYTENLTLYTTVDIQGTSYSGCTISGVHIPPAAGRVLFQSLTLTSATHIFSSAVAGSATISVDNCEVVVTNGFMFNLASWTGPLLVFDTGASGTNDGFVNNTGGSLVYVIASEIGSGSSQTMVSTGAVSLYHVEVQCPVNLQTGGSLSALGCYFQQAVTFSNNCTATVTDSRFSTGSTASITHSSSGAIVLSNVSINTTAIPAIAGSGAGVLTLGSVVFLNATTVASTLTVAGSNSASGGLLQTGAVIQTFPNTYLTFKSSPLLTTAATTAGAATGATGATNLMHLQNGDIMEQFILGAGQTIIGPRMSTTGLLTSLDLTNTEGAEYNFGVNPNSKHAYTIGTSPAFFIELSVNAADVGGLDPFVVGFRKQQANDATFTNYTDFATIGARATTAADVVVLQTNLNGGGAVITNTTTAWTDGQTKVLRVNVSSAGVVTYLINGVAPAVTAAFTFDSTDIVMPFIRHLFGAATPAAINWISLKIGYQ